MEDTLAVAKALYDEYHRQYGTYADEMRMHKLMYFLQRESLIVYDKLLFEEDFYGWKYGPVLKSICHLYYNTNKPSFSDRKLYPISSDTEKLISQVVKRYGGLTPWHLSLLSHGEFSWKTSRKGLKGSDNGDVRLDIKAMKIDSVREAFNRREAKKSLS